jgi:hypothetical protein
MFGSVLRKILDRIICVSVYGLPFLELYLFFNPFLRSYRISDPWIEEAAIVFRANTWFSYLVFALIVGSLTIKKIKLNFFRKYNLLQALMLIFAASFLDTADFLFPFIVRGQGSILAPFFNFICFGLLLLVIYCAIFALIGKIPNVPLLTRAVLLQIQDMED